MKISLIKQNLKSVITSLEELQKHRDNLASTKTLTTSKVLDIAKCKKGLEQALENIESESLKKIAAQIKNRRTKRHTKKLKTKEKYGQRTCKHQYELPVSTSFVLKQTNLSSSKKRELRSAKRYLASIDCLETLHQLRGGEDSCKLKESLNPIKSIWQCTEHVITAENSSLSKSWDKVLFGGKSEIEVVSGLGDFVERRCIWDSYLDSSNGSSIPVGWVCPKEDARLEWKQYLQLT